MKKLNIFFRLFLLIFFCLLSTIAYAQPGKKTLNVKQLIESRRYIFVAESAMPMSGGVIQLISPYDVKVVQDSLVSELPYFGTAYSAPIGSNSSPLSFISADFDYQAEQTAKGNYNISIKINTPQDPDQLNMTITPTGRGSLTVNSTNRQTISFNGYIKMIDKR